MAGIKVLRKTIKQAILDNDKDLMHSCIFKGFEDWND